MARATWATGMSWARTRSTRSWRPRGVRRALRCDIEGLLVVLSANTTFLEAFALRQPVTNVLSEYT